MQVSPTVSESLRRRFRDYILALVGMSSATRSRCYDDPQGAEAAAASTPGHGGEGTWR